MKSKIIITWISMICFIHAVQGQTAYKYRHSERWHQRDRFSEERGSGHISQREFNKLRKEGRRIHQTKRLMLRDGKLNRHEKRHLKQMRRHHKHHIWQEKNDYNRR